ncbi:MAG: hypothetical protein LBK50_03115 [Candidatus Nomurabacteria bacterium]|jgi:hypothetical protein|nr:hypothetical protein [Candidatus Nomurabacteria bacterium]
MDIERWENDSKVRKHLKRLLRHAGFYVTWTCAIVLMFCLVATAWALRANNLNMLQLREAVIAADEGSSTAELENSVAALQSYIGHHMNTSMGTIGIVLQHTYDRDVQAAVQRAVQAQQYDIPPEIYAQYDAACAPQLAAGQWHYTNCISSHIDYAGKNFDFSTPNLPPPELYYVNFTPPHLSLDLAGLFVIVDFLLLLFIIGRTLFNLILRAVIKLKSSRADERY